MKRNSGKEYWFSVLPDKCEGGAINSPKQLDRKETAKPHNALSRELWDRVASPAVAACSSWEPDQVKHICALTANGLTGPFSYEKYSVFSQCSDSPLSQAAGRVAFRPQATWWQWTRTSRLIKPDRQRIDFLFWDVSVSVWTPTPMPSHVSEAAAAEWQKGTVRERARLRTCRPALVAHVKVRSYDFWPPARLQKCVFETARKWARPPQRENMRENWRTRKRERQASEVASVSGVGTNRTRRKAHV